MFYTLVAALAQRLPNCVDVDPVGPHTLLEYLSRVGLKTGGRQLVTG